ncbi:anthocyanidin 3-o-glucoside 6''-o-acyltransferase [Phtheirospermum japonicum]|uniref:Anthocyanidin 3-o-glucoside 6''-o-acyltransferase n=1 Tax=Phtheirospermum japonicum TaxID=374723 RepID=A0A830B436_9LAMI|nr:anthocyanidin 3-o-glucoside 6''-o-acyltransferase [Phtheirospermum japonicum]
MATKIVEQCQVAPSSGAPIEQLIKLLHMDMIFLGGGSALKFLIFYKSHCSESGFMDTIVPNLKNSLSLALKHFTPMASKIVIDNNSGMPVSHYLAGQDSLSLTIAVSHADFVNLTGYHPREAAQFHGFAPHLNGILTPTTKLSALAVQLTLFPNQGVCIGIAGNHAIGDGYTLVHFLKTWASINKSNGDDSHLLLSLPSYDRDIVRDGHQRAMDCWRDIKTCPLPRFSSIVSSHSRKFQATFVMSEPEIQKLKNLVIAANSKKRAIIRVSSFIVACAHLWTCLAKSAAAAGEEVGDDEPDYFIFPVNCRGRLDPPLPDNYFGNCIGFITTKSTYGKLRGKEGFIAAAEVISAATEKTVRGTIDGTPKFYLEHLELMGEMVGKRMVFLGGSSGLDFYGIDFGWGRAIKFEGLQGDNNLGVSINGRPDPDNHRFVKIRPELSPIESEYISAVEWLVFDDDIRVLSVGTSCGYLLIFSIHGRLIHRQSINGRPDPDNHRFVKIRPELSPIESEYISAVEWLVFDDDIRVLSVGTSCGYLLIFSIHGRLIHRQIVDPGKILKLRVHGIKQDLTQDTSSEEVGSTGKALENAVAVGIGGNPEASEFAKGRQLRFLANVDPIDVARSITGLSPETTLDFCAKLQTKTRANIGMALFATAAFNSLYFSYSVETVRENLKEKGHILWTLPASQHAGSGQGEHQGGGYTLVHFLKTWASIYKSNRDDSYLLLPLPSYDRGLVRDGYYRAIDCWRDITTSPRPSTSFSSIVSSHSHTFQATFVLSEPEIQKLKNLVIAANSKKQAIIRVSSFVVACAHLWTCLAKSTAAVGEEVGNDEPDYFIFPVNYRGRLDPPLPDSYFGNCITFITKKSTYGKLRRKEGFIAAAEVISAATEKTVRGTIDDFGWGRAIKFEGLQGDNNLGVAFLSNSREYRGGIEIGVSMPKLKMDAFSTSFNQGLAEA